GDDFRTNQYLERAAEAADTDQLPVDITRVRIQLAQGENHAARHGVDRLLNQAPRHPEVLRLAEQAYLRTGAYASLLEVLPSMRKIELHSEEQLQA
ncbi:protoheme IX biogenesis protein HemY, partial [Salmonella enterica subsp. enterica serovar 1,4,[5],12:i:-]|nr:protoheme IX biogenesis protein HemY [Salmonella enterica subsp. enterica serovar 1,4,[5],12:i:-]